MTNSKQKGKRGELELAKELIALGFPEARRGQQFKGGPGSPDVLGVDGLHIECKRTEHLRLDLAMQQSVFESAPDDVPVVMHRKSRGDWLMTVRLSDLIRLAEAIVTKRTPQEALDGLEVLCEHLGAIDRTLVRDTENSDLCPPGAVCDGRCGECWMEFAERDGEEPCK